MRKRTGEEGAKAGEHLLYFYSPMSDSKNPLARLDRQEILWLTGILKDACRERLEKNLVSQEFEDRLYQRGSLEGRLDPRPFLRIWEPRYRKFLEVATDLLTLMEAEDARAVAESLRAQYRRAEPISRQGPAGAKAMAEKATVNSGRKSRSR
jgi:hypothetical protein